MHILSADQFDASFLAQLIELSKQKLPSLQGKILGSLFFEPSTRTRWSFEAAMLKLNGQVLSMEAALNSSSTAKGESLADTFKNCSQLVDMLVVRHPEPRAIQDASCFSDVPVINAGSGANEHPTQALLDYYTIKRHFGDLVGKKLLFTGDLEHSRTINSLKKLLKYTPIEVWFAQNQYSLIDNEISEEEIGERIHEFDIVYMTRPQVERWSGQKPLSKFTMTNALANKMKKNAIILHPQPRNQELLAEVDSNPRAKYFEQVRNGLLVRQVLLCFCLGGSI